VVTGVGNLAIRFGHDSGCTLLLCSSFRADMGLDLYEDMTIFSLPWQSYDKNIRRFIPVSFYIYDDHYPFLFIGVLYRPNNCHAVHLASPHPIPI
jgi:hypothetical protein